MAYTIGPMSERDHVTLLWLADHGYDGDIVANSEAEPQEDGGTVLTLTEPQAWTVNDHIEEDYEAFLCCCGSETLARMLIDFWQAIV